MSGIILFTTPVILLIPMLSLDILGCYRHHKITLHKMTSLNHQPSKTLFANSELHKTLHQGRKQYAQVFLKVFSENSFLKLKEKYFHHKKYAHLCKIILQTEYQKISRTICNVRVFSITLYMAVILPVLKNVDVMRTLGVPV